MNFSNSINNISSIKFNNSNKKLNNFIIENMNDINIINSKKVSKKYNETLIIDKVKNIQILNNKIQIVNQNTFPNQERNKKDIIANNNQNLNKNIYKNMSKHLSNFSFGINNFNIITNPNSNLKNNVTNGNNSNSDDSNTIINNNGNDAEDNKINNYNGNIKNNVLDNNNNDCFSPKFSDKKLATNKNKS